MIRIARGVDRDTFTREPSCFTVVNANSPLQLDVPMSKGVIDFARAGQLMILTPFTLAGAMAPVTIAGALAQQNAEALAGIALAQMVRPGTPVGYGGFTSNVDMKSGAPAFGTPEYVKAAFASGQLARRYGLPWRSSNVNASNAPDAQAAYESQMALWGALMGGANILMHGAGWLEGGLTASFEKFIIDVEMLQGFAQLFQPVPCDEDALGARGGARSRPLRTPISARHTRWSATTPLSTNRSCRTGAISRPGRRMAPRTPPYGRTGSTRTASPNSNRRRWMTPSARSWKPSSPGGRPKAVRIWRPRRVKFACRDLKHTVGAVFCVISAKAGIQ